jgi:hypothetical protein
MPKRHRRKSDGSLSALAVACVLVLAVAFSAVVVEGSFNVGPQPTPSPFPTPTPTATFPWGGGGNPTPTPIKPTPTPTLVPTPTPNGNNLAPIPNGWGTSANVPGTSRENVYIDTNVRYNGGETIRIDAHDPNNIGDECDVMWGGPAWTYVLHAGNRIIFTCYIKTSALTGGRIGIDFFDSGFHRIAGTTQLNGAIDYVTSSSNPSQWHWLPQGNYVPINSGWTMVKIDMIVPATMYADGWSVPGDHYAAGTVGVPVYMGAWLQNVFVTSSGTLGSASGSAWYGGPVLTVS